jgi:predicted phosphodiesterase
MHSTGSQEPLAKALEEFAQRKLREGFDVVVLGHSHVPVLKSLGAGWYLNPGGWVEDTPRLGCFDGEQLRLLPVQQWIAAIG